ncbi:hypothetical protein DFQ30_003612 [Apophysomyces sp. BC1015]|nr:hypothetical protein DFQ30_003612 [Apophysomyces sp. BC1015]
MKLLFSIVSVRPEKRLFKVVRKRIQAAQRRTIVSSSSNQTSTAAAAAAAALSLGNATTGAGGGASGGGLLFPRTAIVGYARVPFGGVRPLPPPLTNRSPCIFHQQDEVPVSGVSADRYIRMFTRDGQSRGMGDLIQHSLADKRPGLVRRSTVGNTKDPYYYPQVYLSIMLNPTTSSPEELDCDKSTQLDQTLIQSIHALAERVRLHFAYVLMLLRRLMGHSCTFDVALEGGELRVIFPPHLFAPYPPTKERARLWLDRIGIDPESPHFTIDEEMKPKPDHMDDVFGPEYFKGIHLFLDHVDDLIEMGPAFYHRRHSR